jgi:SAM domain (Sterile alpha motif)
MQQIADRLEKFDLGQYAERFSENDIDFAILEELTDQDLEKIGVSSLGHRRKLLRAHCRPQGRRERHTSARWWSCVASRVALAGLRRAPPSNR